MPPSDFLLSGYYGFQNTGDEAILQSAIYTLKQQGFRIGVLSQTPPETAEQYQVSAYHRKKLSEILRGIRESKVILSGGGGLFQDATSLKSLLYYLRIPFIAKLLGKRTMIFAQGIGPINTSTGKFLTRTLCNHFIDVITVRDEGSKKLLERIGVKKPIQVTADLAFLLPLQNGDSPHFPQFAISLRDWPGVRASLEEFSKIISSFSKKTGAAPLLLPFQPNQDVDVLRALGERLTVPYTLSTLLTPQEILAAIQKCEMVIGMRFHSLVFAARASVPFVGIAYDEKVKNLADGLNFPVVPVVQLKESQLEAILLDTWKSRMSSHEKLLLRQKWIVEQSEKTITEAIQLLRAKQ